MRFLWPSMLWLLAAVPLLIGTYVYALRRRSKAAVRYANLGLVRAAMGRGQRIRRHVPPVLLLLAVVAMLIAVARPSGQITLPSQQQTIILAIDVSGSMRATDMEPNRISAAQLAAKTFLEELPPKVRVGIVSFAGSATVVQAPTQDREALIASLDRFQLQRHTATGSGLILSLATLLPDSGIDLESFNFGSRFGVSNGAIAGKDKKADKSAAPAKPFTPVPPGSYNAGVVILLSDGRRTTGPDPVDAARLAAERGVRVYTVGFGSRGGGSVDMGGWSMYMMLDEEALKTVADITKGEYFFAGTSADLKKVYETLSSKLVLEKKETELGAFFSAAAALFSLTAAALSFAWFRRLR